MSDIWDECGQNEFVEMLEAEMAPKPLTNNGYLDLFHGVGSLESLYDKLCIVSRDFAEFVGSPSSSDDDDSEKKQQKKKSANVGKGVSGNVLATLIEAGDEAGEELLAEQLGYVKVDCCLILCCVVDVPSFFQRPL